MGYRGKLELKEKARELRAKGWTMPDIAEALGVAKSSVSSWTHDIAVVMGPRRIRPLAQRRNKLHEAKLAEIDEMNREGIARIGLLDHQALLAAGAALYAGEGGKTDGSVSFANSDPAMVAFFCAWLRRFFSVDESRLRVWLYLHEGLDLDAAEEHWSHVTDIPRAQFGKAYRAEPDAGIRNNKHEFGCVRVSYSCSRTHRGVMGLVRALLSSTPAFRGGEIGITADC